MALLRSQFCALLSAICLVRSTTGLYGEYVTQDMLTRCPVASASLATCAQLKGINLDFLDANSCIECLTGSSSTDQGTLECDKVGEQVCQAADSCSANCTSIAGNCSKQFGELLDCQLEKGVPIGNCTVSCSSAVTAFARHCNFWGALVAATAVTYALIV